MALLLNLVLLKSHNFNALGTHFNAEIAHINGIILPPSGRAICFAAASRRQNPGAHYEL